ncbi:aminotransferase class I/II-fold pyridoxal phosphate-dependent enzyme [Spirosoma gilvum]
MSPFFDIDHLPNRTITYNSQEYLFFSGTAYLGLPQNPAFQDLMQEAIRRYGTVFGSSRNGNLRLSIYEQAEEKLASTLSAGLPQTPSALTLSSGMMAGQVIMNWLRRQGVTFIYAPNAHPAIWHEPAVALPSLSFSDWVAQLPEQVRATPPGPIAILTNSLDAVCSDYYPFDWIDTLPNDHPITLVVDDSHGVGVLNNGRGIWPQLQNKPNVNLLVTASLAKAMGLPGGVILGSTDTIRSIRQTAFFGACSPMPPAYLDVFLQSGNLYAEAYEQLCQNIELAEKLLLPTGLFHHAEGYPVFFTRQDALYPFLLDQHMLIYSFAYPTAADRANTRIVISAFHTPEDIETLANAVHQFAERSSVI